MCHPPQHTCLLRILQSGARLASFAILVPRPRHCGLPPCAGRSSGGVAIANGLMELEAGLAASLPQAVAGVSQVLLGPQMWPAA